MYILSYELKNQIMSKKVKSTKTPKVVSTPKVSKGIIAKVEALKTFDKANANTFKRLLATGKAATIANMGLNKAVKHYITTGKEYLTPNQLKVVTFNNVVNFISTSKYKDLPLFSVHQITLICNGVIKLHDANTARQAKAEKQNKAQSKK